MASLPVHLNELYIYINFHGKQSQFSSEIETTQNLEWDTSKWKAGTNIYCFIMVLISQKNQFTMQMFRKRGLVELFSLDMKTGVTITNGQYDTVL